MAILARRIGLALLPVCWVILACAVTPAQAEALQLYEQKIRAALVYNFLKDTEWPEADVSGKPLDVCIFGARDPFGGYLDPIEERTVRQHPIKITHVSEVADTAACHLLFIDSDEKGFWPQLHDFLANRSILTVGDFDGFSETGGMIRLGNKDNRIYIELNIVAISAAHLRIYDSLRRLSAVTHTAAGKGE